MAMYSWTPTAHGTSKGIGTENENKDDENEEKCGGVDSSVILQSKSSYSVTVI